MAIQENDIGLVSFEEFDEHQTNADDKILHVTQTEKDAWNGKAGSDDLKGHKEAVELDHPDGSVTSDKIANEAITEDKLSAEVQNKMAAHDNHAANIENPHQTSKAQVGLGNVDNVKQAAKADFDEHTSNPVLAHPDGSVTTEKIADKGVTAGKIADAAVGTSKIATGAVTSEKIADGTIKKANLESDVQATLTNADGHISNKSNPHGVTKAQLGLGNVDNTKQATKAEFDSHKGASELDHPDKSVTTPKIADGAVTSDKLGAAAVIASKLGTGSVTTEKIATGAVGTTKMANGSVTADKLGTAAVETAKVKDSAITRAKINDGAVDTSKLSTDVQESIESREKSENKGVPDGYVPLDSAGKIPNEFLYGQTVKEYGVRWKGTSSTVCERLGDAVGLVANAQLGVVSTVQNDFDNIYPWSEMRLCNLDAEGNILAYAGEPSFTRDGTNGDVMVQIPKFYYKREKTAEGYEEWWICAVKLPGYELHPVFMDDGKEVSAVFHSAYNASVETLEDGTTKILRSISGVQPSVRTTRATFRTRARNKGTGWSIEDIACVNALQMLYMVEYASTHSQAKLGSGVSSLNYTATHLAVETGENTNEFVTSTTNANKYRVGERIEIGTSQGSNNNISTPRTITAITAREDDADISVITFDGDPVASIAVGNMMWNVAPLNGSCDELGGGSGYIGTNGRADSAYRGIEGFHGKLFRFIDGVNIKDHLVHYANSIADYADRVYDGKYRAVGYTNGTARGYISEFGYDEKAAWVMFPTEAKGGSTTYVPDYYYQDTGERLLALGGSFNDGGLGGVFGFGCHYSISTSYLFYGAHLLIKKP